MTDNPEQPNAGPVPPKLDLRRIGTPNAAAAEEDAKPIAMRPTSQMSETLPINTMEPPPTQAPIQNQGLRMPSGPQPQTIHIKIPKIPTVQTERTQPIMPQATGAPQTQPPFGAAPEMRKKETSKIPLATARPSPTITGSPSIEAPKTIRIKPRSVTVPAGGTSVPQAMLAAQPLSAQPLEAEPAESPEGTDKRKTSRISLESALIADAEQDKMLAAKGPKTIRLQRPQASTAATVKMPPSPGAAPVAAKLTDREPMVPTAATFEETSQIEAPPLPAGADSSTDTRRKTIKVKRPTQRPGVTTLPSHTIGHTSADHMQLQQQVVVRTDEMHTFFPIFAIVTLIIMIVAVYMLTAQVVGPDASLTEYSYAKGGPDLSWYGKLPPAR